jgi:molecular chaperone HscA
MTVDGSRLAIDLGTSHTVAAVQRPGRQPQALLFDGSPVLPSGVFASQDGTIHTGRDAERLAQADPARFEPQPKRRIDEGTVLLGDSEHEVPALLAAILNRVNREAAHAGVTSVVLTCPADWGRSRRRVLREAAARAGIHDPVLVDEPVAAAAYCTQALGIAVPPGQALLVFDFGGGTLDLALVRADAEGPRVVGVAGLEDLGGLDVDAALVGHLGQLIAARDPAAWQRLAQPADARDLRERRAFWAEVRAAKEMLSRTSSAPVALPGAAEPLYLTRDELERLAGPLIDRAVDETRRLLSGVGLHPAGLAAILLVGGSSRIPLVAARLQHRLRIEPVVPEQPELPVAHGALIAVPAAAGTAGAPVIDPSGPVSGVMGPVSALPGQVSGVPGQVSGGSGYLAPGGGESGGWIEPQPWQPAAAAPGYGAPGYGAPSGQAGYGAPPGQAGYGAPPGQPGYGAPPQQPGHYPAAGSYPPAPPATRRTGLLAGLAAAAVVVLLLIGGGVWLGVTAFGSDDDKSGAGPAGAAGTGAAATGARGAAPADFAWCEGDDSRIFCPTEAACFDADDSEIPCEEPHVTQLFAGGYLAGGPGGDSSKIAESPEVKAACSEKVMTSRSIDKARTAGWDRYSQWLWVNGQNMFYCLAGPAGGGETTGSAFRTD